MVGLTVVVTAVDFDAQDFPKKDLPNATQTIERHIEFSEAA